MTAFAPTAPPLDDYILRVGMVCWATVIEGGVPVWRRGFVVRKHRHGNWFDVALPEDPAPGKLGALGPITTTTRVVRRIPGELCKSAPWARDALS